MPKVHRTYSCEIKGPSACAVPMRGAFTVDEPAKLIRIYALVWIGR